MFPSQKFLLFFKHLCKKCQEHVIVNICECENNFFFSTDEFLTTDNNNLIATTINFHFFQYLIILHKTWKGKSPDFVFSKIVIKFTPQIEPLKTPTPRGTSEILGDAMMDWGEPGKCQGMTEQQTEGWLGFS